MHRRSPSAGALVGDVAPELLTRLPPRSPLSSVVGQRTPPTCPTSPLIGSHACLPNGALPAAPVGASSRSSCNTPTRPRASSLTCHALPPVDLAYSHVLSNIVTSVYESNITAEQCFSTYGQLHTAPPLLGIAHPAGPGRHVHSISRSSAGSFPVHAAMQPPAAAAAASLGIHHHLAQPHLLNDISDVDFGLATCLATPMDPGKGLRARLAPLPATTTTTTTAAARNAAYKLTSANDVLQEASRYGDWVRRQERRRKLEKMQRVLSELGAHALLGRLLDDTTLPDMDSDPCWDPDAANLRTQRQRQAQEPQEFPHSGGCGGEDNGGNGAVARPRPPLPPPPQQQQQQQLLAGLQPGGGDAFGIRRGSGLQALGASRDARELDRLFRDDMALKN